MKRNASHTHTYQTGQANTYITHTSNTVYPGVFGLENNQRKKNRKNFGRHTYYIVVIIIIIIDNQHRLQYHQNNNTGVKKKKHPEFFYIYQTLAHSYIERGGIYSVFFLVFLYIRNIPLEELSFWLIIPARLCFIHSIYVSHRTTTTDPMVIYVCLSVFPFQWYTFL